MNTSIQQESQFNLSKAYSEEDLVSDLDPMLEGGTFKVAFYRQCPFEIRETDSEGKQFGIRNILNVRIMANPAMEPYLQIKLQITSEVDLYLVYECKLNQKKFERLKKLQNLNFNYANLLPMLIKLFGLCDKFPQQYSTLLYMSKTGAHRLTIIQNIEYKSIELLTLQFESVDQQLKKQCLSFRFSLLKSKNERIEVKTREMLALVKLKNPNLLQSIAKKGNTTAMGTTLLLSRMNRTTTR